MTSVPTTKTISSINGALVTDGSDKTTLLANLDSANTIYLGIDQSVDVTNPSANVPLPPGASVVVDDSYSWYAAIPAGESAQLAVIPGGISFFQLLNLIVRNLTIAAGGSITGQNWKLSSIGYVQYNGTPAFGNVIQSYVPQFADDQFNNPVVGGKITQFITANGQTFLSNQATAIRSGSGGSAPGTWTNNGAFAEHSDVSTFSLTTAAVGDVVLVAVAQQSNKTVTATTLASTNATWTLLGTFKGVHNTRTIALFAGLVTAAATANVTITWSGATPSTTRAAVQEFTPSSGSYSQDGSIATMDTVGGQAAWPVMTPAGSNELYWGYNITVGTVTDGTQPDFVYTNSGNASAYNLALNTAGEGAIWGSASQEFGATVLLQAGAGSGGSFTGLIMAPGAQDGQACVIWNTSPTATLTFATSPAVSNIADSALNAPESIAPLTASTFIWSANDSLWYAS